MKKIQEHVIEIRYSPDAQILDKRGGIAETFASVGFAQWSIGPNKIDLLSDADPSMRASFSFRNLGLKIFPPRDSEFFKGKAGEFIKAAWNSFPHADMMRMGVRIKTLIEVDDFNEAYEGFRKNFLALTDAKLKQFGGDLVDVGFPLVFIDGKNKFKLMTGPMEPKELGAYFENTEGMEKSGIFLDMDYFCEEFSPHIRLKQVNEFIETAIAKNNQLLETIKTTVLPEKK